MLIGDIVGMVVDFDLNYVYVMMKILLFLMEDGKVVFVYDLVEGGLGVVLVEMFFKIDLGMNFKFDLIKN